MPRYEEFCPRGLINTVIPFEVKSDRIPKYTTPCICGGDDSEKIAMFAAQATQALLAVEIVNSVGTNAQPREVTVLKAKVHSSAIRFIE